MIGNAETERLPFSHRWQLSRADGREIWARRQRPLKGAGALAGDVSSPMILYAITDRRQQEGDLLEHLGRLLQAGPDLLQIREKDLPARELFQLTEAVLKHTEPQRNSDTSQQPGGCGPGRRRAGSPPAGRHHQSLRHPLSDTPRASSSAPRVTAATRCDRRRRRERTSRSSARCLKPPPSGDMVRLRDWKRWGRLAGW